MSSTESIDLSGFSHYDPEYLAEPDATWAALRAHPSIAHSDEHGGFHVIARYADLCAAANDTGLFSSAKGVAIPPFPFTGLIPGDIDPPRQHLYRKILNPYLTPRALAPREPQIRTMAHSLMDGLLEKLRDGATVNFMAEFAVPLPQQVALRVIGFPDSDRGDTAQAIYDLSHLRGIDDQRVGEAAMQVMARIMEFIGQRRDAPRENDLISGLLDGEIDGEPLSDNELLFYLFLLLFGGLDTTTAATAGTFHHLGQHPEVRARLRADPDLRRTAVEEFLRWTSPIQGLGRVVTRDSEFAGCPVKADEWALLLFAAGNRDGSVFEDPDELRLDRSPNPHLTFGFGPHRCMGSHLAKLMLGTALDIGLERLGEFHVVDPDGLEWAGGEGRQLKSLPIRLGAPPA